MQGYIRESGCGLVFPRVELCLQEPDQDLVRVDTNVMDSKSLTVAFLVTNSDSIFEISNLVT